ncbi:unnamed protein product [Brachionus calyciflorus]|uniref:FLYWCH-type domain-containing protein n=1 Tax=Brachionus calyciflorus TaxID=104777 RepID=A0A813SQ41_9BILA|nr:unnamed protein product [Brachionus calyciflorus]
MEIDYESDYSSISSAQSSTAEESNMEESEVNNDEIEDDQEFKYTIPFEKTETKRKRMAIKIGKETFVFKRYNKSKTIYWQCQFNKCPVSVTTLDDLGCLKNQTHLHDCLSEAEYKCLEIEEFVIQRAINEETPIPKLFCEELDNLVTSGLEHQQIAAYINFIKTYKNFLTYFEDTWFEGNFESKLWNHAYTIGPRTNNHVEGFHNKLNKWIVKPHPNIYQLISVFQKIDTKIHIDYQTRLLGKSGPKCRAVDIEKDNRYQNLLEYLEMNVIDLQQYLRSCSFLVNFNNIMNMV